VWCSLTLLPFYLVWQIIWLLPAPFTAQTTPASPWPPATLDQLRQLQRAALRDDYAYQRLLHLTDHIGPRATGSLQAAAAVDYVANEMRQLGLEVKLEKVKVPRWVRGEDRCELVVYPGQVRGTTQKIVVAALGASRIATGPDGITADIVVVNSFAELAALPGEKVSGKIVLFNVRFDRYLADAGLAFEAYSHVVEDRADDRAAPPTAAP